MNIMKELNQIKQLICRFWIEYTKNIFAGENIFITISIVILSFVVVLIYFYTCFQLIKVASQKQNQLLVLFGILLSGILPGIIYYINKSD